MDEYYEPQSPPAAPRVQSDAIPLRRLLAVLGALLLVWMAYWLLPAIVERYKYASARGQLRAQAEVARAELAGVKTADLGLVFSLVAKSVSPSVVHIDTRRVVRGARDESSYIFGIPQQYEARGQGSGVIVDGAGYIITNNHVVEGAQGIDVRLADGRSTLGRVVGADPLTDLAVVKVDETGLIAAEWGDSDKLEVGSLVWAIGNPFGLDRSVTFGIVSAKNRRSEGASPLQDFLQTDAAVNPGNSGGPLVNIEGKIVGINTAIIGQSYQGVSFSIPSNTARDVYERLRTNGKVARGWLGVALRDLTPQMAESLKLDKSQRGALIEDLVRGGPAEKAGLKVADVVVEWDGQPIDGRGTLSLLVARTAIGSTAKIVVLRDGQKKTLDVQVEDRPAAAR